MKALKSMKAVKYFKEGYVQGLKTCVCEQYCFISSQTKASMKQILYQVEICLEKATADILAAQCSCPAGEWPSAACSHVAATLFAIEDYSGQTTESTSCTSRLQQWHKPSLLQHKPTPVYEASFVLVNYMYLKNHQSSNSYVQLLKHSTLDQLQTAIYI